MHPKLVLIMLCSKGCIYLYVYNEVHYYLCEKVDDKEFVSFQQNFAITDMWLRKDPLKNLHSEAVASL